MDKNVVLKRKLEWRVRDVKKISYLTNFKEFYEVNETFLEIWESLNGKKTLQEIANYMIETYPDVNSEEVIQDIIEIADTMVKNNVVMVVE